MVEEVRERFLEVKGDREGGKGEIQKKDRGMRMIAMQKKPNSNY